MKRDEALRVLSREHLGALTVAKKLREAEDAGEAARVFLGFWEADGRVHFRVEEEVLLPAWARAAAVDREGTARMLEEHLAIRREALRLDDDELTLEEIHELGRLLHDHVRFEERQLFPAVEADLDPAELTALGEAIDAAEASNRTGGEGG